MKENHERILNNALNCHKTKNKIEYSSLDRQDSICSLKEWSPRRPQQISIKSTQIGDMRKFHRVKNLKNIPKKCANFIGAQIDRFYTVYNMGDLDYF